MTVYKPVENLAKMSASIAVDMANGIAPDTEDTIDDGTYTVPYMKLDPIAVTRENKDELNTGKYHSRSEIYLNVAE